MRFGMQMAALGLALGGLSPSAVEPLSAQHPPVVRGQVLEERSGHPVAGAVVQVLDGTAEALTAPDGTFLLRGLLPGTHRLRVEALGYLPRTVVFEARNGRVESLRLELYPAPLQLAGVEAEGDRPSTLPPGAVILDSARIRSSGAQDVGELLASVPGVTVTRLGGPGAPARVSIRGSSSDEVLVLLDGLPVNSVLTGDADLSTVPVDGLERVVVLPGGRSARYGPRAVGGVVLLESGREPGGEVALQGAVESFGGRKASLELGGRSEGVPALSGLLAAAWSESSSDFEYTRPPARGGGLTRRKNADASRTTLRASGEWRPAPGDVRVRGRLEAVEIERGMPGSVVQPSLTGRQAQSRYGAVFSASGESGPTEWRGSLQLQRQDARLLDVDPPTGPAFDESTRVDGAGVVATTSTGGPRGRGEVGIEARRLWISATSLSPGQPHGQTTLGSWASLHVARTSLPDWRLAGEAGFRVDWSSRLSGPWASPRLALSLDRGPATARFAVSSSFSPPSLSDQFFQEGVLVRPNPELRPERVRPEVEVGVDLRFESRPALLSLTAEAYRADVEGMIIWFPDHRFIWSPRNVDVRRRGSQIRAQVAFPGPELRAEGSVSHAAVEYAGGALYGQVVYRPELTADLGLEWSPDGVRGRLDARYTGSRRTVPGSELNSLEAFWTVDLAVGFPFHVAGALLELRIRARNLLDRQAAMLPDYPMPGRSWSLTLDARPFHSRSLETSP